MITPHAYTILAGAAAEVSAARIGARIPHHVMGPTIGANQQTGQAEARLLAVLEPRIRFLYRARPPLRGLEHVVANNAHRLDAIRDPIRLRPLPSQMLLGVGVPNKLRSVPSLH